MPPVITMGYQSYHPQLGSIHLGKLREPLQRVQMAELRDLDGHGQLAAAKARDHLGVVDNADKLVAGL